LNLASTNDDLEVLQIDKSDVSRWLEEWSTSPEESSAFLKSLSNAFEKAGQRYFNRHCLTRLGVDPASYQRETSYSYVLLHLQSIPAGSPNAQQGALEAIATALRLPSIFNFDSLLKIDALQSAKTHQLFALLKVFLNGELLEYKQWEASNASILDDFGVLGSIHPGPERSSHIGLKCKGLSNEVLERKIRFLTLASLCTKHIGRDLPYDDIASTLQIDKREVEGWVIDGISRLYPRKNGV
jgi:translation initiation factor 3 subunit M